MTKILAALGYAYFANIKGSHDKWRHGETGKLVLVPHNLQSRHTANAILKSAGSSETV
ncbi:type II toxin-antitoxin system HicA family toxin [Rhizobium halophytocola]|uniref:RNA binding protein YcfA (HicA-like mRNA interferase family) n=1 Tax=Rhizobium halophytocola TaxID=735519 RepID=A0ABS4DXP3_9HYPH|nr:putative RNA binding protein YcfA (HicA-like mRNA interferase family) [Rhizobium halophytocola]